MKMHRSVRPISQRNYKGISNIYNDLFEIFVMEIEQDKNELNIIF